MITAFRLRDGRLEPMDGKVGREELKKALWIDLSEPSEAEVALVRSVSELPIPDLNEVQALESSSHYAVYDNGLEVNCLFLDMIDEEATNHNVAFIVDEQRIITMSATDVPEVRLLRNRCRKKLVRLRGPRSILLDLLETKIEHLADTMEDVHRRLVRVGKTVLSGAESAEIEGAIEVLAREDDIVGKVRLCLMDGQRDISFLLKRKGDWLSDYGEDLQALLADLDTLIPHNAFLSEKIDFLLNAAQGFINIQQNQIIKIFSIAAVVFLPPTLVASSYGMNFEFMPELSWPFGYPLAILLMVLSAISPYLYFKRKGWL